MYILKISLTNYFVEIDKTNQIVITSSPLLAMIFDDFNIALKFKTTLKENYNKQFNIIEL